VRALSGAESGTGPSCRLIVLRRGIGLDGSQRSLSVEGMSLCPQVPTQRGQAVQVIFETVVVIAQVMICIPLVEKGAR
jgi:hypothetical protein